MRRVIAILLATVLAVATAPRAQASNYWEYLNPGNAAEAAGDLRTAVEYWKKAIPLIEQSAASNPDIKKQVSEFNMCGVYAQKVARALDQFGDYDGAIAYFQKEIDCWEKADQLAGTNEREDWMRWDRLRMEQIVPRLEVFVSRPTAGVEPRNLGKFEPAFGALIGGTVDHDPAVYDDLDRVAATYGKPYGMVMIYNTVGEYDFINASTKVLEAGLPLQIAWQPTRGLHSVTEPVVRAYAKKLAEYGKPVFLRFANEMNGSWVPWYGDPELYKQKFRLVARIMREEAPNVAMVWAPNYVGADYMDYYPGDEWVDWVGVSAYHDAYFLADMRQSDMMNGLYYQGQKANPLDKFKEIYALFADRKPIMIAETGYNYSNNTPEARKQGLPIYDSSEWAAQTARYVYAYLPMVYPRIKMVGHFNNPRTGDRAAYTISQNPTLLKAVREAIADDWYLSSLDDTPETYWLPIEQATLHGKTRLASYVWLGDRGLGRVEYLLDGRVVATRNAIPYVADLDLSGLSGQHVLTVRAYDKSGRLAAERSYAFDASAVKVKLNGRVLDFAKQPVNEKGTVLVPFRSIAEALGAEVQWNPQSRTVIARKGGTELRLTLDDPVPVLNGRRLEPLPVPARTVDGHTMVPARVFAEAFGMKVQWDGLTQTVVIESVQPEQAPESEADPPAAQPEPAGND